MTALLPRPSQGSTGPGPAAGPPRADCVADTAGGLTFDLVGPGRPRRPGHRRGRAAAAPARAGRTPSRCRSPRPHGDGCGPPCPGPCRCPKGTGTPGCGCPAAPTGGWRPAPTTWARSPPPVRPTRRRAGSWPGSRTPPVAGGSASAAGCAPRTPRPSGSPCGPGRLTVTGRLYGAALTAHAYGEIRAVDAPGPLCRVPVTPTPEPGHPPTEGTPFTLTLPHPDLAADGRPRTWSLWLRPAGATGPEARLARLLGPGGVTTAPTPHPPLALPGPRGPLHAAPLYTPGHDLTLRLSPALPPPRRG